MLITGGTGSFGQAFTRRMLDEGVKRICIYSRDEYKQAVMREKFNDDRLRFFIGDVRDVTRLRRAMEGVSVVVHAAALKRIETGFYNPDEMVKTNVLGAMNVIEACRDAKVRICVALSSDKAYQPISAYGQSKALAESLFLAAESQDRGRTTRFAVTRYGNVAGSKGSVIPKWRELIRWQKVITLTDPECTRFWMTMGEAVDLVCDAISGDKNLYIPTLPAYKLHDLAVAMGAARQGSWKTYNESGLPAHEKLHESMCLGNNSDTARRMTVDELREALKSV